MAPAGTVTVRVVEVAAETVAFIAPNQTVLLPAEGSKLLPVIVTVVPTGPERGVKELITGCAIRLFIDRRAVRRRMV